VAAEEQLARARAAPDEAESAGDASLHDRLAFHQFAQASQARAPHQEAQLRADFACRALGRECVEKPSFVPPDVERELEEVRGLRRHLERLN